MWVLLAVGAVLPGCDCNVTPSIGDAGEGGGTGGGSTSLGGGTGGGSGGGRGGDDDAGTGGGGGSIGGGGGSIGGGGGTIGGGGGSIGGGGGSIGGGGGSTGGGGGSTGGGGGSTGGGGGGSTGGGGGGSTGGGGGSTGGGGGTTTTLDTFVCAGCPGAADTNLGTQNSPLLTIGQGLRNAQMIPKNIVTVATTHLGVVTEYTEDLTVPPGVTLEGRWAVTSSGPAHTWARTAVRTTLRNTQATGLKFAGGSRTTILDGFVVSQAPLNSARLAGITITSSPLLRDFAVVAPLTSSSLPMESVGIDVIGGGIVAVNPRFEGTNARRSSSTASGATQNSVGLVSTNALVEVAFTDFNGGTSQVVSRGAHLVDSPGSSIQDSTLTADTAVSCFGFLSQGAAGGVLLERVNATGCPRQTSPSSAINPRFGWGAVFDACTTSIGGSGPVIRGSTASGGVVGGTGSLAVGGAALDGCNVRFEGGNFTGLSGMPATGPGPDTGTGIACSFRGLRTASGADARCNIVGTTAIGGFAATARTVGVACEGSCAGSGAACRGSCEGVATSDITGGGGASMTHLMLVQSSPVISRNHIGFGGNGTTCGAGATVIGLELLGSASNVVNNLILGGPCSQAIGVGHTLVQRADNSTPSPNFQNNTIVATSGSPLLNTVSVGVRLNGAPGSAAVLQGGVWRNNIIQAGPATGAAATLFGFQETSTGGDPSELRNNLFFVLTPALNAPLYRDENATTLTSPAAINALTDCTRAANLEGDPVFLNPSAANYHLGGTSPARAAGSTMTAPVVDIDGDARPNPTGSNPDIGSDEVN